MVTAASCFVGGSEGGAADSVSEMFLFAISIFLHVERRGGKGEGMKREKIKLKSTKQNNIIILFLGGVRCLDFKEC